MPDVPSPRSCRITLRPNRYGLVFAGMLVAMLAGAANYHSNLGLLMTFLLTAMAVAAALSIRRTLARVRVVAARAEPVFAGQTALVHLSLTCAAPAMLALGWTGDPQTQLAAAPGTNLAAVPMPTASRGALTPGPLTIAAKDPLGLTRARARLAVPVAGMVYPRPIAGPWAKAPVTGTGRGVGHDADAGDAGVDDFKGLRPYQPGDRLQHISWKGFSKGHGLMTKQFSGHRERSVMLDWDGLATGTTEEKLSWLCDRVIVLHRRRAVYGLRLPGIAIDPGCGAAHKHHCLTALALYDDPSRKPSVEP